MLALLPVCSRCIPLAPSGPVANVRLLFPRHFSHHDFTPASCPSSSCTVGTSAAPFPRCICGYLPDHDGMDALLSTSDNVRAIDQSASDIPHYGGLSRP